MKKKNELDFFVFGGFCGILGTLFYVLSTTIPLHQILLYTLTMAWPILSIIFVFAIYKYVELENKTFANQLAAIFASLGFVVVACMISVQLAVKIGIDDFSMNTSEAEFNYDLMLSSLRLVDHGLDVAWDLLIGTSLIFLSIAIKGHSQFRLGWAIPAGILGIGIIVLNIITFPWPPNTKGLIDIGPLVGLFIIAISIRLIWINQRLRMSRNDSDS